MANTSCRFGRKVVPWLGAGVLLQVTGCGVSSDAILQGIFSVLLNNVLVDLAIGIFNTPI